MAGTQGADFPGAVPVPEGETYNPDFSHPWLYEESRAIVIAGLIFSTLSLALRVYTKATLLHKFGWDDVSMIGAWLFAIATQALCLYGYAHGGIGLHIWNITPQMFLDFQKGIFAAGIVYVPSLALAKASLIILYYRIVGQQRLYRYALYFIAAVVIGYSIAITFALIFACRPIAKAWNGALHGTCVDQNGLYAATAVTNTVTDVALIVVAIPVVWSLHMPTIQKIGLFFMFVVGCATVITSIIRLVTLFPFLKSNDKTYRVAWTDLWINVEANFIIICACLPFLRHFLRRYAPKLIGEGSSAGRYFKSYNAGGVSTTRSWRRRPEHTVLQDEIELAEGGGSATGSAVRIMKEVQWDVTEERREGPQRELGELGEERRQAVPGMHV
ncbi:uncharacterized protein DSM5745_09308 [Aspergillus mulundensis]|uniref:Rhodopsin domain-containing protein n=1 Tax=Aspergillus mulundensis TaxID=1810919 RepID=A0A3D8R059_9EURO|nr:Uncharacterized protein DSM5745_09308 [Aspergillus mulundensis]RDW67442.1 Uncharacterized protein DSM5745_09308 [Aspergillus mulundensis]